MQALAERFKDIDPFTERPIIPAMTTDAERECYYRLAKQAAGKGAIVELGAWMGASTAYIAAGVRDSGVKRPVWVYDHFISKSGHVQKVKEFYDKQGIERVPVGPSLEVFKDNLGPLMEFVEPIQGAAEKIIWDDQPIALLVTDAPKRIPAISAVLTRLRKGLQSDSIMAWQDFCHFPSYEIAACLYRLRARLEFVEAVVPGTTLVFKVRDQWTEEEVSLDRLSLDKWDETQIRYCYEYWLHRVHPEKKALFRCGQAMFLCDVAKPTAAVEALAKVFEDDAEAILPKWRYLWRERIDFRTRYAPLFDYLSAQGAL